MRTLVPINHGTDASLFSQQFPLLMRSRSAVLQKCSLTEIPSHPLQAVAAGQLGPMQLAMTPGAAPSPPVSEYNASGKKRRFCGACQNHNMKTPVTFQHQQQCQWRACPCNLCVKKRSISQAQVCSLRVHVGFSTCFAVPDRCLLSDM